ncbi:MAG TPA: preprotein translocase subunit YajC [Polyangiaceae bacterium]|nr:preprotein translocase subunit YajC [Polyangiaceae bacterium]
MTTYLLQPSAPASDPAPPANGGQPTGGGGGGWGGMSMLVFLLPVLLLFLMSRNQNKKQKDLETGLKAGDRVITRAGAIGKIVKVHERTFDIELAPGVFVPFLKSSIEGLDTGDIKKDDKSDKDKSDKKDDKSDADKKKAAEARSDKAEKGKS